MDEIRDFFSDAKNASMGTMSAEDELRVLREHFDVIYKNTTVSIWDYIFKTKQIVQPMRAQQLHGFGATIDNVPDSLIEQGFIHPDSAVEFRKMYDKLLAGEKHAEGVFRVQTADRSGYWYEHIIYNTLFDTNGEPYAAVGMSTDVTNNIELQQKADRDDLTGLLNRRAFEEQGKRMLSQYPDGAHVLFMMDINDFKDVNDTYGHAAGDRVLKCACERIRDILKIYRQNALVARIGGDEFAVLMVNSDRTEARYIANLLLSVFESYMEDGIKVSAGIGISVFPKDGEDFEKLGLAADRALYHVKRHGKRDYCFYDSIFTANEGLMQRRHRFLSDTLTGGMVGGYMEPGFPFYFVDNSLLSWLGYGGEEEFVEDIGGMIENGMHPDDRDYVSRAVEEQLATGNRYTVDYRMKKRDGSYIWVHDIGERMTAPDGRAAITSVCYDISKEKEHNILLDRLLDGVEARVALYRVEEGTALTLLHASKGIMEITNYSDEEYSEICKDDAIDFVYEPDRDLVRNAIKRAVENDEVVTEHFRLYNKKGGFTWTTVMMSRLGTDNGRYIVRIIFMPLSIQNDLQLQMLDSKYIGVYVIDEETDELYFANDTVLKNHGAEDTGIGSRTCYDVFFGRREGCESCWRYAGSMDEPVYHEVNGRMFSMEVQKSVWNSRSIIIVYSRDVTEQFMLEKQRDELFNNIPGGISLFRIRGEKVEPLFLSAAIAGTLEEDTDRIVKEKNIQRLLTNVHPNDLQRLTASLKRDITTPQRGYFQRFRIWKKKIGKYIWVELHANIVADGDDLLAYATFNDITKANRVQEELEESQRAMEVILRYGNLGIWSYDIDTRELRQEYSNERSYGYELYQDNVPDAYIERGVIHKDDAAIYRECYDRIIAGEESSHCTVRVYDKNSSDYFWMHIYLVRQNKTADGKRRAIGFSVVVDNEIKSVRSLEKTKLELQKANGRFAGLLENTDAGIVLYSIDESGKRSVEYVSRGFCKLWGGTAEDYAEAYEKDYYAGASPEYCAKAKQTYHNALNGSGMSEITYHADFPRKDVKWVTMQLSIFDENGRKKILSTFHNVTEMMETQEELKRSREELQQSWEMLETACTFAGVYVITLDIKTRTATIGETAQKEFLLPEIMEDFPESLFKQSEILPEYEELCRDCFNALCTGKKEVTMEFQARLSDKRPHWLRLKGHLTDQEGERKGTAIISVQNIDTERAMMARVEAERQRARENEGNILFYFIANISKNSITEYKLPFSDRAEVYTDLDMESFVKEGYSRLNYESDRTMAERLHEREVLLNKFQSGIINEEFDSQMTFTDGVTRWTKHTMRILQDPFSSDVFLYEYVYDVSREHIMNAMLLYETNCGCEAIGFLSVKDGQLTTLELREDKNTDITETIMDFSDYIHKYAEENVHPDDRERYIDHYLGRDLLREEGFPLDIVYRTDNGGRKEYLNGIMYKYDDNGRIVCTLVRRDVTDIIRSEEEKSKKLSAALEEAKKADMAKSEFMARMSHDMRTPMNAILGMTHLAAEEAEEGSSTAGYIEQIEESSRYLLGVINDILEMSRIENGKADISCDWYTVQELVLPVVNMIEPTLKEKGIQFDFNREMIKLSGIELYMDKQKVQQMLMNLLNNACKFTPEGGRISLSSSNISLDKENHIATDRIVVEDNGCGMSKEFLQRIFRPFEQERLPGLETVPGTGLGLSIARSIAKKMGGDITVESEIGKGSKFTVTSCYRYRMAETENIEARSGPDEEEDNSLAGSNILLAEDNRLNAIIATKLLEKIGMRVETVSNGQEAVERFAETPDVTYDMILMDIRMPVMDGLEAARHIRRLHGEYGKTIPIVAMSANAYEEDRKMSLKAGMNEHLSKPVEPKLLYQVVRKYLSEAK